MNISETLQNINALIDQSVTSISDGTDEVYNVFETSIFYNAVSQYEAIQPKVRETNNLEYIETGIRIGKIQAYLNDSGNVGITLIKYDGSVNTIKIGDKYWVSNNTIQDLYAVNNVNSDWELFTGEYIIVPSRAVDRV